MEDSNKLALTAKRKADAEKRAKLKRINNMYSVIASEMPADWVKQDNNRVALVEAIHKDILGLDRNGRMRPMGDFVRFMNVANQAGLNPFLNEIYAIYFYDKSVKGEKLNVITGINGLRKAAAMDTLAVMRYVGEGEPVIEFKNPEQKARLKYADMFDEIPHKVTTEIKGLNPVTGEIQTVAVGIAYWDEYVSLVDEKVWENGVERKTGRKVPNSNWAGKPIIMLKKCAAADGLRKAYPNRLNAIYERAEVEHLSDAVDIDVEEQENEQIKKINEAVNQRRSKGNVFEQKAKEAIGN